MASWRQVRAEAAELAGAIQERFAERRHCTIATLRADGSPRISGIEVQFTDDEVTIGSMPGAVKARDLQRDPRFALHSATVDPPEDPTAWPGEAKLAGLAVETSSDGGHVFRLDLREVVLTRIAAEAQGLEITSWHDGRGVRVRRRS